MTNIYNLFKFLEDREGKKMPLSAKLIYAPEDVTDEELNVKGHLALANAPITMLPDNLNVEGHLDLSHTKITSLPNNLEVGGILFLYYSLINSIPNNLQVRSGLNVSGTPLAEKYTEAEIRKMIKDKGGWIGGEIVIH